MIKQKLLKLTALAVAVIFMFVLTACEGDPTNESGEEESQISAQSENEESTPVSADESEEESEEESEASETSADDPSAEIAKINGGADDVGIYSVVVRLTDKAADKGTVELVYHGAKGSPQENSIVNTFRIEYYKEASGTFEISTFFNGEIYQNQHHKDEVKVTNTFDATLRAGDVTITYTPDGGEPLEIFKADADYFR